MCLDILLYPGSSVSIVARSWARGLRFRIRVRAKIISLFKRPARLWGAPSLLFSRYRCSLPEVKRPGPNLDHSPASSAKLKNEWSYNSTLTHTPSWRGNG